MRERREKRVTDRREEKSVKLHYCKKERGPEGSLIYRQSPIFSLVTKKHILANFMQICKSHFKSK